MASRIRDLGLVRGQSRRIYSEYCGTKTGFCPKTLVFPSQLSFHQYSAVIHLLTDGRKMEPLQVAIPWNHFPTTTRE